ncbi:MAG: recombinase family protein, partial [Spirochaetales bacterium]|nr:recombinase family protein [Spirochaetales bacterium]
MTYRAYARVSTEGQSDTSIEDQLRFLQASYQKSGADTLKEYHEKESGRGLEIRAALQCLISEIEPGDIVGFDYSSRFGRSVINNHKLFNTITEKGGLVEIAGQRYDLSKPTDKLIFSTLSAIDEYQADIQKDKSLRGIISKKEKGEWIYTSRLYGYKLTRVNGQPHIDIVEEEADVLRYLFTEYSKGKSLLQITKEISSLGHRARKGTPFPEATLRRFLHKT